MARYSLIENTEKNIVNVAGLARFGGSLFLIGGSGRWWLDQF